MFRDIQKKAELVGLPPGALPAHNQKLGKAKITISHYSEQHYQEWTGEDLEECTLLNQAEGRIWINIQGPLHIKLIEQLTKQYKIHPLTIEDITNSSQRPKVEEFENYEFVALKLLTLSQNHTSFSVSQVNLLLGKDFLVSFQEDDTAIFSPIYERIRSTPHQRMREQGSDYLFYRLIDSIIDNYFIVLETLGNQIDEVEESIIANPKPQSTRSIYRLKRRILLLRKVIWPAREVISHLLQTEEKFITPFTRIYLRDVYDHVVQAIDSVETFRDMLSNMLDIYLSSLTNRMNEVMKTLTIIATIFIPMTFIASLYGMNFKIPELQWQYGYYYALGLMAIIAIVMLIYFRQRKWI